MKLRYREIGTSGQRWPAWLRELDGKSGVYAIREGDTLVYVGESHKGRLYTTITRHFQRWRRKKKWWSGLFGKSADPGYTYERGACSVAVVVMRADRATAKQYELIQRLKPRDNQVDGDGIPEEEEVPF